MEAIRKLKVGDNEGHFIPLDQLADMVEEEGLRKSAARTRSAA